VVIGPKAGQIRLKPDPTKNNPFGPHARPVTVRSPIADCRLPIADRRRPIADRRLPIADGRLPIADRRWPIAG
jgi:hypothetical protein